MSESAYRRRETNPGYIRLRETRPTPHGQPPPKVLLVEARAELRELLSGLLERRGMEVTVQRPEETDLLHGCPGDG